MHAENEQLDFFFILPKSHIPYMGSEFEHKKKRDAFPVILLLLLFFFFLLES